MSTYKALVLESFSEPLSIKPFPIPTIANGTVLVQPLYATLESDLRDVYNGNVSFFNLQVPLTPGGCCVARVEAVPPDAVAIKPGDIVWVELTITARDDPDTKILLGLMGGMTPAANQLMRDGWRNGVFAEKAVVPLENVHVLPESLFQKKEDGGKGYHYKDLASLSHVLVAYGGLEAARVTAGTTVIVAPATGKYSGGAVLDALAMGAKVVAAGRNEEALKKLYQFPGAKERLTTVKLLSDSEKDGAALLAATGGKGANVYIDFSPPVAAGPTTPTHITAAISALRRNGQVLLMGGMYSNVEINYADCTFRSLTIRGVMMYERKQIEGLIRMVENGNLVLGESVGLNIAGTFALEEFEKAIDLAEKGTGWGNNVVFAPNE
ncbi:putative isopropanol dehydrogenase [Pyrenochaeta sp. MPI-SDFR-AT-0127]|nr:putative isopropanol dehydrogenase [Pyrenochaeta sp. MPI-SDFR-AT-0127]